MCNGPTQTHGPRLVVLVGECCGIIGISRRCRHVGECWRSMTLKDVIYEVLWRHLCRFVKYVVAFDYALTRYGGRDVCRHADMLTKTTRLHGPRPFHLISIPWSHQSFTSHSKWPQWGRWRANPQIILHAIDNQRIVRWGEVCQGFSNSHTSALSTLRIHRISPCQ
jgi:hypothetical protein